MALKIRNTGIYFSDVTFCLTDIPWLTFPYSMLIKVKKVTCQLFQSHCIESSCADRDYY